MDPEITDDVSDEISEDMASEDAAIVLEEFLHDVANLPAEINHLYEEIQAKEKLVQECRAAIAERDSHIQKFIRQHGSLAVNPKEEGYVKAIRAYYDRAEELQQEKVALSEKATILLDRHIRRLDVRLRELARQGVIAPDPAFPSTLNAGIGDGALSGSSMPDTGASTPMNLQAPHVMPGTTIANSHLARLAQPQPQPMRGAAGAGTVHASGFGGGGGHPGPRGMPGAPHLTLSAPATPGSSLHFHHNQGQRESSVGAGGDVKRRRGGNAHPHLSSLPLTSSALARQSSVGPAGGGGGRGGTPKPGTPSSVRSGSVAPRKGASGAGAGTGAGAAGATSGAGAGNKRAAAAAIGPDQGAGAAAGAAAAARRKAGRPVPQTKRATTMTASTTGSETVEGNNKKNRPKKKKPGASVAAPANAPHGANASGEIAFQTKRHGGRRRSGGSGGVVGDVRPLGGAGDGAHDGGERERQRKSLHGVAVGIRVKREGDGTIDYDDGGNGAGDSDEEVQRAAAAGRQHRSYDNDGADDDDGGGDDEADDGEQVDDGENDDYEEDENDAENGDDDDEDNGVDDDEDDEDEDEEEGTEGDDRRYCSCRNFSHGNMVACDNDKCPYEWFHWSCVGVTREPAGKWYCPDCRPLMEAAAASAAVAAATGTGAGVGAAAAAATGGA